MIISSCIHVAANGIVLFFIHFFIHSSVSRHLGYFHVLAIVRSFYGHGWGSRLLTPPTCSLPENKQKQNLILQSDHLQELVTPLFIQTKSPTVTLGISLSHATSNPIIPIFRIYPESDDFSSLPLLSSHCHFAWIITLWSLSLFFMGIDDAGKYVVPIKRGLKWPVTPSLVCMAL